MHKYPEEIKFEFYLMVAWSHTRSWKMYKLGNSKTKNNIYEMFINKHVKPYYDYPEKGWYIKQELGFLMRVACCVWDVWPPSLWETTDLAQKKIW